MTLTTFACFYLPVLLGTVLFAPQWLPALLILSTCLQATSVLNVPVDAGMYGISVYNATALFAFLLLVWRAVQLRALPWPQQPLRPAALWFGAYVAVAIVGAFVLPHLHAGVPVYLLLNQHGFDRGTTPLVFTVSNLVQAANLAVHVCVLAFLLQARTLSESAHEKMLYGLGAAVGLVLAIGFYERMASLGWWDSFNLFWMNNPGYAQLHNHAVAGFRRIVAPFSEASYATTFFAAVWVGLLAVCFFGRARPWQLAALPVVGIGLINPLGSTGWVAAGGASVVVLLLASGLALRNRAEHSGVLRSRVLTGWVVVLCIGLGAWWAWSASPAAPRIQAVVNTVILNKLDGGSAKARHRSNERALQIVKDTAGMGAGLGSNRASSYFASMVSNTGVLGLLCFVAMLAALSWRYATAASLEDAQIFAIASLWTATLAVALAIPDLNLPTYWAFVFLAFVACPQSQPGPNAPNGDR